MSHLNIEWKARTADLKAAESKLLVLKPRFAGEDLQTDTYFETKKGRLKIREGNIENSLIWYERENIAGSKSSNIILYKYEPDPRLREILTLSNGVKVVVKKKRKIYFIDNVKFHFDTVEGLGTFIETEAIDTSGSPDVEKLQEQCSRYADLFELQPEDYLQNSYSDMLLDI